MGIQINGQTDTVSSTTSGGKVTITPFNGNVGTGASISSPATNVLTLGTNNTESVRINSTGVGIGTNNPASTLDVGGEITIRRTNASSEGGQINFARASDNTVAWNIDAYGSTSTPSLRFIDNTAAVVRMQIDGSGRVTMPYQPCFSVYRTTDQNIAHNALTKVQFNTENFDVGSNFDSSTNFRFTAPVAGKYAFMGVIYIYSVYQAEVSIYKNGAQFKRYSGSLGSGGNDNPNGRTYAGVVDLAVNDYVEIYAYMTRTGDSATQSIYGGSLRETSFDGYLIG